MSQSKSSLPTPLAPSRRKHTTASSSSSFQFLGGGGPYLKALRPRQWTKNLIVFAAPLFAFSLTVPTLMACCLAFTLFCCASSSFYLINDIVDVKADRQHPVKCKRPIAAGLVSIPVATFLAIALLGTAITTAWMHSRGLGAAITSYAILQVAYNFKLKRLVILDIIAIAAGFVLRAYAGSAASHIPLSSWFLLCTAMLALFLGIEKRKAELRLVEVKGGTTRAVLQRYSAALLTRMESTVTTGALMTYAIWSSGPSVHGATTPWMVLTFPFVLYGIFRYQLLSDPKEIARRYDVGHETGGKTERPEEILLSDLPILLTVLGWIVTTLAILSLAQQGLLS